MRNYLGIVLLFLLFVASCKTNKNVAETDNIVVMSSNKIINNHYTNNFNQQTIYAKLSAKYSDKRSAMNFSIKLRLEKDKTIWMSATKFGIPVAKIKITPDRVSYYEKLQKVYFDGDFSLLSKWLGTDLDYEKVQNILLGQAVINLKKGKYISSVDNNLYQLTPKKDNDLFGILFFMNPENFKLNKQEIRNQEKQQIFSVSYPKYREIKGEQFPKNIHIRAIDHKNLTTINIEYRSVEFNEKLTFPFSIPNGYKEISLK